MKKYILLIVIATFTVACDHFLTVRPKSEITEKELFTTPEGVEEGLYGVYSTMAGASLYGKNASWYVPDILAHYYAVNQSMGGGLWEMVNYDHENARDMYGFLWNNMYQAIGYVNNVINSLDREDASGMRYYALYKGEALGLRAFMHFDLVRLFAPQITEAAQKQGIPYVRQWTSRVTPFRSVGEVYRAVISELKEAERLLEEGEQAGIGRDDRFVQNRRIHFNLHAARATLARVYWMERQMDSAAMYARKVIDAKQSAFAEQREVAGLTAGIIANKEAIWGLYSGDLQESVVSAFYTYSLATLYPASDYKSWYPGSGLDNDLRLSNWFGYRQGDVGGNTYFMKLLDENHYLNPGTSWQGLPGINMLRLPEMYLIMAEALLPEAPDEATAYFDAFISARGLQSLADKGRTVTLADIQAERRKEWIGEGQEWFRMKRENAEVRLPASGKVVPGTPELYILPIPLEEFEFRYEEKSVE